MTRTGKVTLSSVGALLAALVLAATALAAEPLDPSFGSGGKVTTSMSSGYEAADGLALQPDGKVVAAGAAHSSASNSLDFALARYNADGSLDTSFGEDLDGDGTPDGKTMTDFGSGFDGSHDVKIQPDGKIVAAGYSKKTGSEYDFALARYNVDGSLDTTFGSGGKTTTGFGSSSQFSSRDEVFGVEIQADGKIVAAGSSNIAAISAGISPVDDFALARYNPSGSLDTTFDSDGKLTTAIGQSFDRAHSVALQPDGKIVAAGYVNTSGGHDFALARYNPSGSLDTTFDSDGKTTTTTRYGYDDDAYDVGVQPDGKVVAAGASSNSASSSLDFSLMRYNAGGSLDTGFGDDLDGDGSPDGKALTTIGSNDDAANSMEIQPDGKIVAAGYTSNSANLSGRDFALARYEANGSLDQSFHTGGKTTTTFGFQDEAQDVGIQPDGKIIAAGFSNGGNDFALARYLDITTPPDTTVPTVSSTYPASGATSEPLNTNVVAAFSEEMDPETLTTSTVQLHQKYWYKIRKKKGKKKRWVWTYRWVPVSASVSCDSPCKMVTFDPSSDLAANTNYLAGITTEAKDKAGNALAENYSWSFTTGSS